MDDLPERRREAHQASQERIAGRREEVATCRLPVPLQRNLEGDAVEETPPVRVALLHPRRRCGSGPARLPQHHQAAHGPGHHQGEMTAKRLCNENTQ